MNFDFSHDQYQYRDAFRDFLQRGFPQARAIAAGREPAIRHEIWRGLADLGLFGLLVPGDYGGLGLSLVDLALLVEELSASLVPPIVFDTLAVTALIVRHGNSTQKAALLPGLAKGRLRVAIAASEASGYAPASLTTEASIASAQGGKAAEGILQGNKLLVPEVEDADMLLVLARDRAAAKTEIALVNRDGPGLQWRAHSALDLTAPYFEVTFKGVGFNADERLSAGEGAAARLEDIRTGLVALELAGIAARMLDTTVAYAGSRRQFGKPIGSFQAIKHRCADVAVTVESARTAAYYAVWTLAEDGPARPRAVSMAKSYCGDAARLACNQAIQVHGGMGFTWDLGLHYYLRRAKHLEFAWGDGNFHRERVLVSALAEAGAA